MRKIKIANVIEDGRLGGPQHRIISVAKQLDSKKFSTTVILPYKDSEELVLRLQSANVPYKELSLHRLTLTLSHLALFVVLFIPEVIALSRYLRSNDFDVVHVSGGSWQWKGVIAGRLAGCRVLWHLNDTHVPMPVKVIFKVLANCCCDAFILAGKKVEAYYGRLFSTRRNVGRYIIQAPVNCTEFDPAIVEPCVDIATANCVRVMTVANINRIKGLELLIDTAKLVQASNSEIVFYIVGPVFRSQKSYYKKLQEKIKRLKLHNVIFYGPSTDVKSVLAACDIYFCSSLAEASPMSVWEAMSMGKPIVSTSVGDVPHYVVDGESGFVCDLDDVKSLSEKIILLGGCAESRTDMGRKARKVAIESFDISTCVAKHEAIYGA